MRSVLAGILASLLFFALAGAASANDGVTTNETGNLQDPDLVALRQALDEFRTQVAALADACSLKKEGTAAGAQDCKAQYAALRAEFKQVRQAALVLVRNQHEWAKRAQQEAEQLKKESEKTDSAKHDEDGLKSKSLADKLKWIDDRLLQDKADLEAAQQHAKDARDAAAGLSGDKLAEANEVAAKWDEKAAQYAEDIKRLTTMRQQLVAASQAPKACASNTSSCSKDDKRACASNSGTSCTTTHDRLVQQLKSLDETINYKKQKLAELKNLLAYKLAQANVTTGDEQARWLELAQGVRGEIDQWTGYLNDLLKQREYLVQKLNSAPTTSSVREELTKELKSLDDLAAYKRQKIADADAANDQDAVSEWTAKLNDVLSQRAAVLAKLNALPQ